MKNRRNRLCCAPLCLASLFSLPKIAGATDFAWLGGADSQWSNKNNWNPIGIPSNGDNASIYGYSPTGSISLNVNYDSTVMAASLGTITVSGDGDGSLTANVATLNILSGTLNAGTENIGTFIGTPTQPEYGSGVVNQSGGANNVVSLGIGDDQNYPSGTYNLSGSGLLNVTSYERVGYFALPNNAFNQTGGTHTFYGLDLQGSYSLSSGTLTGTSISARGGTVIQSGGNATVQTLYLGGIFIGPFGVMIPLTGTYTISAGSLNVTTLSIGGGTTLGTLSVSGSGQVTATELDNSNSIQVSGGTLDFTTLLNDGSFSWTGGALVTHSGTTFDNSISEGSLGGLFNASLSLTSGKTLRIDATETLGSTSGFTLSIPTGGSNIIHQLNISSEGTLSLAGGTLTCTAIDLVGQDQHFRWTVGTLNLLNAVTLDPNASTLTTGSIFGGTLSLNNRTLTAPTETITSTSLVRGVTMAVSVGASGNNLVSGALTVDSLGSLTVSGGTVSAGTTNVLSAGKLLYSSGTFSPGTFNVSGTGVATFSAPSSTVVMNSLSVDNTAKLDIGSTKLIVHLGDQNALRTSLQNGYDGGAWDKGLHSSQAAGNLALGIGYLLNAGIGGNPLYATFGGQPSSATDTLITSSYYGDANLDGKVDIADLKLLAQHWNMTSNGVWSSGDFNYDGVVNVADLLLLAKNWQSGDNAGLAPLLTSLGLPQVDVPEPSLMAGSVLLVMAGLRRRRRIHVTAGL